jgi:hypothetical protein
MGVGGWRSRGWNSLVSKFVFFCEWGGVFGCGLVGSLMVGYGVIGSGGWSGWGFGDGGWGVKCRGEFFVCHVYC